MSTLKVTTIQNLSGVEVYTVKAWVNFNGTGTVAIRASGGVSSITDLAVGRYRVNFTNAMPDANYQVSGTVGTNPTNSGWGDLNINDALAAPTTTHVTVGTIGYTEWQDTEIVTVSILR
jgi:hypothetical protein